MNDAILYALLTAFFASLVPIFGKIGVKGADPVLISFIKTFFLLIVLSIPLLYLKSYRNIHSLSRTQWISIFFMAVSASLALFFFLSALKQGRVSVVFPITKMAPIFSIIWAFLFLSESISLRTALGIVLIITGIFLVADMSGPPV